ncbi:MAG: hypothetical protein ABI041_07040 [Bdellovibrionia bacterium]
MKKTLLLKPILLFLFLSLSFAHSSLAENNQLPTAWYLLPEDSRASHKINSLDNTVPAPLSATIESLYATQQTALESISEYSDSQKEDSHPANWIPWHLDSVSTDLGVTAQGLIGLLAIKGTPALNLIWRKHKVEPIIPFEEPSAQELDNPGENSYLLNDPSEIPISAQIEPIYRSIIASGKINEPKVFKENLTRVATDLNNLIHTIDLPSSSSWWLSGYRFDFIVSASGRIAPAWLSLGGELRVRLEWYFIKPIRSGKLSPQNTLAPYKASLNSLVGSIGSVLHEADSHVLINGSMHPFFCRVGVGVSAQGQMGIAKGGAQVIGHLLFSKDLPKKNATTATQEMNEGQVEPTTQSFIPLIEMNPSQDHLQFAQRENVEVKQYAQNHGIKQAVYKIPTSRVVEGLKKAFRIVDFLANRPPDPKKRWQLYEARAAFDLSLTGTFGLASVSGLFSTMLYFR